MNEIIIKTIPHKSQKYETIGNYYKNNGIQYIFVSDLGNPDMEALIALHEFIELTLCDKRGIKEEDITRFDIEFEKNRKPGNNDEPGFDPKSPYRKEHVFATKIERLMAKELGVDWEEYENI